MGICTKDDKALDLVSLCESQLMLQKSVDDKRCVYWPHLLQTVCLGLALFTITFKVSLTAAAFMDLLHLSGTSIQTGSYFFLATGCGAVAGSALGGFLFETPHAHQTISLGLCLNGIGTALLPWTTSFEVVLMLGFLSMVGTGLIETGVPYLVVLIWREKQAPYLQMVYVLFSMGAVVGPLIAGPFLSTKFNLPEGLSNFTVCPSLIQHAFITNNTGATNDFYGDQRVWIAFMIMGGITLTIAAMWNLVNLWSSNPSEIEVSEKAPEHPQYHDQDRAPAISTKEKLCFLFLVGMLFMCYDGMESAVESLLPAILVKIFGWTPFDGAAAASLFGICFMAGEMISVYLVQVLSPFTLASLLLIFVNTVYALISLNLFLSNIYVLSLIGLLGFVMGPIYQLSITITNKYWTSAKVTSWIMVLGNVGCLAMPAVTEYFLADSSMASVYFLLFSSIVSSLSMLGVWFHMKKKGES